jgi:hypothetical protein
MPRHEVPRYTVDQIMCALQDFWDDWFGALFKVRPPFGSDTRIDTYMRGDGGWGELDLADLWPVLEREFGFKCERTEWVRFFGGEPYITTPEEWEQKVGPRLTFGALATFIAERVEAVSYRPVVVLGNPCETAGAFRLTEAVARDVRKTMAPIAPSTPIGEVLQGEKLKTFWRRLRVATCGRLAPLQRRRTIVVAESLRVLCLVATVLALPVSIMAMCGGLTWLGLVSLAVCTIAAPSAWLAHALAGNAKRLLPGVHTFADLARKLVAARPEPRLE